MSKPFVFVPQIDGGIVGMSKTSGKEKKPKSDGQDQREAQARASAKKKSSRQQTRRELPHFEVNLLPMED